ncbi:ABC transporter ATP-binding protein [Bradyrhizobium icense]|uniref:ABC transporter ATP-binding protein n=1 Tax=Bradyrhizobium icense TaxID=1274631 RepID=UPI000AC74937|nr:ABC transporter ATP-binding protein [Bradyrhizobium icense]
MIRFGAFIAVKSMNLQVGDAEFVAVVGPTGCGKSAILNTVTGLLKPASGDVQIFGKPLTGLNDQSGYMLQQEGLLPWKTAQDNVGLGLVFHGKSLKEARAEARPWLAKVGLTGFEQRYPHQLSGGQRKHAAMAQTVIMEPKIILMDEPFSTPDVHTRRLMHPILPHLWQAERRSSIFITHDLDEAITDRVVVMSAGPASRMVGEVRITLPRPRDVSAVQTTDEFVAEQLFDAVPARYKTDNRELNIDALKASKALFSQTGPMDAEAAKVPLAVLSDFGPRIATANIDLSKTFTNRFAERAAQQLK